jgi:hypothetical protein
MKNRFQIYFRSLPDEPLELDSCRSNEFAKFDTLEQAQRAAAKWAELYQDCECVVREFDTPV